MDANDIELVAARDNYDFDEVYPGDDLHESETSSYHPQIRKQNRCFVTGFSCLLLLVVAGLGFRFVYMPFRTEADVEFMRGGGKNEGTVNDTYNEHAKVSEALMSGNNNNNDNNNNSNDLKKKKKKEGRPIGNAASQWAANNANNNHKPDQTNNNSKHPTVSPSTVAGDSNHDDSEEEPENNENDGNDGNENENGNNKNENENDDNDTVPADSNINNEDPDDSHDIDDIENNDDDDGNDDNEEPENANDDDDDDNDNNGNVSAGSDSNQEEPENDNDNVPTADSNSNNDDEEPEQNEDKLLDLEEWHNLKVTQADGVKYEIIDTLVHDPNAFLEGLTFFDGKLWESVGLNKQSAVKVLHPDTGETLESFPMESKYFAEGLTYCKGKLIQLTYKKLKGFVYDAHDLSVPLKTFDFKTTTGEGWGLTYDDKNDELIVSDGSAFLHFWDPDTFEQKRKQQILRLNGKPALQINELEWWRDRVVANVWFEHVLLIINPVTGLVEKEYDFSTIWDEAGIRPNRRAEVFNGISVSSDPDILYVTGKLWSHMFKVKLLPEVE